MNATEADTPDEPFTTVEQARAVESQARLVMGVLKEYSGKLAELTNGLLRVQERLQDNLNEAAWLLDQSEVIRKPLLAILSRGSGLREGSPFASVTRDELSLRMFETEVHLHHATRMTLRLRDRLVSAKLIDQVAKMRVTAGLPAEANAAPLLARPLVNV